MVCPKKKFLITFISTWALLTLWVFFLAELGFLSGVYDLFFLKLNVNEGRLVIFLFFYAGINLSVFAFFSFFAWAAFKNAVLILKKNNFLQFSFWALVVYFYVGTIGLIQIPIEIFFNNFNVFDIPEYEDIIFIYPILGMFSSLVIFSFFFFKEILLMVGQRFKKFFK